MKPADFLIGILDFFAVLLPGCIAVWLVGQYPEADDARRLLAVAKIPLAESGLWAVFLIGAYMLGHFVFMIGSGLDRYYDRWRDRAKPKERDKAYLAAEALRSRLNPELVDGEFSTLKWAKSYVQLHGTGTLADIDRLEATSKFFRSSVVIAAALATHFLLRERRPGFALVSVVLAALSYRRFVDQRWKATELTYASAAVLAATKRRAMGSSMTALAASSGEEGTRTSRDAASS